MHSFNISDFPHALSRLYCLDFRIALMYIKNQTSEMFIYFSHTSGWRCTIGFLANYHHYGMFGMQLCNLCYGLKIVIMEKYNTDEYLRLIEWHRVSFP